MKRYIFLCDVDGTLVRNGITPPIVVSCAKNYMESGGLLALCTGRSALSAGPIAGEFGVNMPCVLYGGAMLYDFRSRKIIWSQAFAPGIGDVICFIYDRFPALSLQVYTQDAIFTLRRNEKLTSKGIPSENTGPLYAPADVRGDVLKLVLSCDDRDLLAKCLESLPDEICIASFASRHFIDVVPRGAGKAEAMRRISELYNVPYERFFCAGDSLNDLPMLKLSGRSYAPANALPPVLEAVSLRVGAAG